MRLVVKRFEDTLAPTKQKVLDMNKLFISLWLIILYGKFFDDIKVIVELVVVHIDNAHTSIV